MFQGLHVFFPFPHPIHGSSTAMTRTHRGHFMLPETVVFGRANEPNISNPFGLDLQSKLQETTPSTSLCFSFFHVFNDITERRQAPTCGCLLLDDRKNKGIDFFAVENKGLIFPYRRWVFFLVKNNQSMKECGCHE